MRFFVVVAFIVVAVVVMQTAFAHVRSSTSVQEQANADFIEGLRFHRESILAQIPRPVASTVTREAATIKLAGAKDISVESFQNGAGQFYTSGFAYNITRNTKSCSSGKEPGNIQYITALALGCIGARAEDFSVGTSCNVDKKKIEYATGYWLESTNCKNFDAPPDQMFTEGVGNNCNVDSQKFGVFSGCGENNFIRPAVTAKDSSIISAFFPSNDDCKNNKPHFLTAYPLKGCMVMYDRKGEKITGSLSFTDCTVSGSITYRMYKSPDCKGTYNQVSTDNPFGSAMCTTDKRGDVHRFLCNKPM